MSTSRALMTMGGDTSLSLELPKNQTFDEWAEVGKNLASANKTLNWWIGDWWAAGSHRYGERAKVAAEGLFGRDYNTLSDYASVCRSFEVTRRRVSLSFTHHREVASLSPEVADKLLDRAEREAWSTRELRAEVFLVRGSTPRWVERNAPKQFDRNRAKELIYDRLSQAAETGEICPDADELVDVSGVGSVATTVVLMHSLEEEGRIKVDRYQRSRQVTIIASGQSTAEPKDKTPHWRFRTEDVPAPTIQRVAEYAKPLAEMIEAKAKALRKPLNEYLMDCVYVGHHEIMREGDQ